MTTDAARLEHNKQLVRRFHDEVWGVGSLRLIDEYVADDYVEHNPAVPYKIQGRDAYKYNVETFRGAFPDLRFTIEDVIAEGDMVVTRTTGRGTHEGEFMGFAPTGNQFEATAIDIWRIDTGQVVEAWIQADVAGMMQQLGLGQPTGAPGV